MNEYQTVQRKAYGYLFSLIVLENFGLVGSFWYLTLRGTTKPSILLLGSFGVSLLVSTILSIIAVRYLLSPFKVLWQTVVSLRQGQTDASLLPDLKTLRLGQSLVTNITGQLDQLVTISAASTAQDASEKSDLHHNFIANVLPTPLIVLDNTETIKYANQSAVEYLHMSYEDLIGKNIYMVLDMLFTSEETFDVWLKAAKQNSATATKSWERVRLAVNEDRPARYFDLAGYYNKDNPHQTETIMLLFDHTKSYSQDDQAVSFIALSVHELRTPLTLLRGYIEVFEEELEPTITPDLKDFMEKMKATSEQLTAFVNNILNVARIDDDQLELTLQEENWETILKRAIEAISLRAHVRGITLTSDIAYGLPSVAVDRLSIQEVINNLVDNAIKYSGKSTIISITAKLTNDGLIETSIQDYGVGISTSILPNLFTKFYRDHRNRSQIGGTGLGLYLCKAIVTAHGGNLWVRSKENVGSTFGFTLRPYSQMAQDIKDNNDHDIVRGAHGWIKNHSLYRR